MKKVVVKRKKAFIGAAIGAIGGIAGSIFGAAKKRKQEREMLKQQQTEQNKQDTYAEAQARSTDIANQDYVDDYQKKVTLRMGGYVDRVKSKKKTNQKVLRCGGRKKAELGTDSGSKWTKTDTTDLINGLSSGIQNVINASTGNYAAVISQINTGTATNLQNNKITQDAKNKRIIDSNTDQSSKLAVAGNKYTTSSTARYGCRKKAGLGSEIGSAAGGIGSLVGSLFSSSKAPKQVKKAVGFSSSAPKIGIQKPDYQQNLDSNGQVVNPADNINNTNGNNNTNNPANNNYKDRTDTYRCGGKKIRKRR